ncbi:MAG TPA: LuxR C-terminal-related transcriptional regulator [Pseudonocardiaceae bacterium]|nr:LuxR C-terminal-related transcriptional regulator [Pseudonocardiaceae bacterium]
MPSALVGSAMRTDSWTLTGRDSELQFIAERLTGGESRSVVIAGPAGVGKTRLAREALAVAKRGGRVTRWAAGTNAAAAIPLGAVAHLLPAVETVSEPLTLLQRAGAAIAEQGKGHRLVIGVDDAHLLDELSVTLLHQLALTRTACVVLTVRTGEPAPDPVVTLWKNGLADRLELTQLPRAAMNRLVTSVLGGVVDSRTIERLWRATRGNALFLRELVEGGCETGSLRMRDGVWRWEGRMEPTPRLREIVQAQLGGLGADERAALELLATDEPLGLGRVASLINPEVVAVLERRGLVTVVNSGWRAEVRLAHPIYATVVRDQLPEANACQLRRRLANTHLPWKRQDDLLRAGMLLLDSDQPQAHASLLADAAVHANALLDHENAARLAQAAIDGSDGRDGVQAHLALVEAVRWQGCPDEAEQVAAATVPFATSAEDRSRLAVVRALNLFFGVRQVAKAEGMLQKAAAEAADNEVRRRISAVRGVLAFFAGRPSQAAESGAEILASEGVTAEAAVWAASAAGAGLAVGGRTTEALAAVEAGWAALARCTTEPEMASCRQVLAHAEVSALLLAGRVHDAVTRATELHEWCMSQPQWAGDALAAAHVGWSSLAAGRPRTAIRWLSEAVAGLGQYDPGGFRQLCLALLAQTHAQLGDAALARRLLEGGDVGHHCAVFEPEWLLAEAWQAAAEDHTAQAIDRAQRAATVAREMGQPAVEAQALHAVVRLGRASEEVADRLQQLAGQVEGPLVAAYSAHAAAAAANAGGGLDEVAAEFETLGARLLATDAAAHAAAAHLRTGDRRRAAASTARAAGLARACEEIRTPALEQLAPRPLTSREGEVASLVVQGLKNQAIAERLVLSVRTVEAHLANAYAKLGISSRAELAKALRAD